MKISCVLYNTDISQNSHKSARKDRAKFYMQLSDNYDYINNDWVEETNRTDMLSEICLGKYISELEHISGAITTSAFYIPFQQVIQKFTYEIKVVST